jgi:serine/threonine protein kinase
MDPLQPGDPPKIGKYKLSARLGAGGMGEVFFGRSPGGRPVAVKLIHPAYAADEDFRRRFKREVEACRRVGGFHTAPVVDADPDARRPWMVTAYVAGPSLDQVLVDQGQLPLRTLRVLAAGLAEALEAIHGAGLIHRDLKPSNILIADDGPRVIDFGIARAIDASSITLRSGTPGFMSPELLTGKTLTPASDVFSFGLVLAHAAGIRPFGTGPADALNYRVVHQAPNLSGLDTGLISLVLSCLAKEATDRPTSSEILHAVAELGDSAADGWLPPTVQTMIDSRAPFVGSVSDNVSPPAPAPSPHPASTPHTNFRRPDPTGVSFRSTKLFQRANHTLRITPSGVEIQIGSDSYRYFWADMAKINALMIMSNGHSYAYIHPNNSTQWSTYHRKGAEHPFTIMSGATVLPLHGWGAPAGRIIEELALYSGPLWHGVKTLHGGAQQ